jgi:hypothetical protein
MTNPGVKYDAAANHKRRAERLAQAEEIIRAKNRLEWAMFNSDIEASWPREAHELELAYEQRYAVNLSGDDSQRLG